MKTGIELWSQGLPVNQPKLCHEKPGITNSVHTVFSIIQPVIKKPMEIPIKSTKMFRKFPLCISEIF